MSDKLAFLTSYMIQQLLEKQGYKIQCDVRKNAADIDSRFQQQYCIVDRNNFIRRGVIANEELKQYICSIYCIRPIDYIDYRISGVVQKDDIKKPLTDFDFIIKLVPNEKAPLTHDPNALYKPYTEETYDKVRQQEDIIRKTRFANMK